MILEKGLVQLMKKAYKLGGYTVAEFANGEHRRYIVATKEWLVACDAPMMPRKALGLLAEHLGMMPRDEAFRVRKDTEAQTILVDTVVGVFCDLYGQRSAPMGRTRLTLDGLEVWQEENGEEIFLMKPEQMELIGRTADTLIQRSGDVLVADTGMEFVGVCRTDDGLHPGVEQLKRWRWDR